MPHGANYVHEQLRKELATYIKAQYFGKSQLLLSAIEDKFDAEGLLYRKPFIESSPAYKTIENGISASSLDDWLKEYFLKLSDDNLGVFPSPFAHQIDALQNAVAGNDLFVSTGTGSGKTECFMWPLLAKLATEARNSQDTWANRGVRCIIMYPMNALVSDQISRLRRMIGDPNNRFISIFRDTCGQYVRRPQFGMYTSSTPYPGEMPDNKQDKRLVATLNSVFKPNSKNGLDFHERLHKEGKIPAKSDYDVFLTKLNNSNHTPNDDDAELITRFEMQDFCPDILITNYSMLEYMLLRRNERKIWDNTRAWLKSDSNNRLLFVIDEAHMYSGSSGGEVAFLIRRLLNKLEISRDRVQFILTTASMPNKDEQDRQAVMTFANSLTANDSGKEFHYLTGTREQIDDKIEHDIPNEIILNADPGAFEDTDECKFKALTNFWSQIQGYDSTLNNLDDIYIWMHQNLASFTPFKKLIKACRGNAVSIDELATHIFPTLNDSDAKHCVSVLLAIAPLAKDAKGSVLFPARMHMLFKGITGAYACTNPNCPHSHSGDGVQLGEIFFTDEHQTCPYCGSQVYELYNDRRCGALFFKGYILTQQADFQEDTYLWRNHGHIMDNSMKELHLYIPSKDYKEERSKGKKTHPIKRCYLDITSGFLTLDISKSDANPSRYIKLYYCLYSTDGRPETYTFSKCPHCRHLLSYRQLSSFSTKGNQSFFNLIKTQFQQQPAVAGKAGMPDKYPNEGRKVLLFSDSRQRAAKLAKDMSQLSEIMVARQLFACAIKLMMETDKKLTLDSIYDFLCITAARKNIKLFHDDNRQLFIEHCNKCMEEFKLFDEDLGYETNCRVSNAAPNQIKEYLLRLIAGGSNTLYDSAICWVEPTPRQTQKALRKLKEYGINLKKDEFIEFFNAWFMKVCDENLAIGNTISQDIRTNVKRPLNKLCYGLANNWGFPNPIPNIMGWGKNDPEMDWWKEALQLNFLEQGEDGNYYITLDSVSPNFNYEHVWFKCETCSELTPYLLKNKCPSCGASEVHEMTDEEYGALAFWRKPIDDAIKGEAPRIIDTEEHTAQLSHKDQRDNLWSKTEQYELRFQDIITDNETPVDILSSTTTMEVGIDIGSLIAVGLRNIPPKRENYQQRAGRAGRRGSSLSTIVTYCEGGAHDAMYFKDPVPMFRGDPCRPWVDIKNRKLLQRHVSMILLQEFEPIAEKGLDKISAIDFLNTHLEEFKSFIQGYESQRVIKLLPKGSIFDFEELQKQLISALMSLKTKCDEHPDLFDTQPFSYESSPKSLLDALYEESIIPTYSFPKNVVSTYITNSEGKIKYEIDRGLDVAISEYAPGRAIVVDKQTYQIGGIYAPITRSTKNKFEPAKSYMEDPNYLKTLMKCDNCGWFGLAKDEDHVCPFCGSLGIKEDEHKMLRPWGFAPVGARPIADAQLNETYSSAQQPLYSTLPQGDEMQVVDNYTYLKMASRTNQRIIMINRGERKKGFMVCETCGAAMPGNDKKVLNNIPRPYKIKGMTQSRCQHKYALNVNLGYDFITDMMVLEFAIDSSIIDVNSDNKTWINRASQSMAEALRLAASKCLDVDFTELVAGFRLRSSRGGTFVDIYLYDSLSSGAGYSAAAANNINEILHETHKLLTDCTCKSACSKCLKHFRNQFVHGLLDRHAAAQLLEWARTGEPAVALSIEEQQELLHPITSILSSKGLDIDFKQDQISGTCSGYAKEVVVYPAMWVKPYKDNTVFISDAILKHAKPYAIQELEMGFGLSN